MEISASGFTKEMEDNFDEVSMNGQELSVALSMTQTPFNREIIGISVINSVFGVFYSITLF